eukprot:4321256-Amphidinium_carterae.1
MARGKKGGLERRRLWVGLLSASWLSFDRWGVVVGHEQAVADHIYGLLKVYIHGRAKVVFAQVQILTTSRGVEFGLIAQ